MIDDVYTSISPEQAEQLAKEMNLVKLSESMRNGAFHPNCRHSLSTYFPGISNLPTPVDEDAAVRLYNAEQQQRYIERQIRKYKRLAVGSLDDRNIEKYKRKVSEWNTRMEELLDAYPKLRRDRKREIDKTLAM